MRSLQVPVRLCAAALWCALQLGCYSEATTNRIDALQELVAFQGRQLHRLEQELNDAMTLALCSPELRQLMEDVQKECSPQTTAATGQAPAGEVCSTAQIRPAVIAADPEHRGRFLKLLAQLRHEVVYLGQNRSEVAPHRAEKLVKLSRQALLRTTTFLIVSSPESGEEEANRRAIGMENLLVKQGIPREKIRRWIYAFPALRADITRSVDLPGLGETRDLHRGVWIFRADC